MLNFGLRRREPVRDGQAVYDAEYLAARSVGVSKYDAEQRAEAARKAWETRRALYGPGGGNAGGGKGKPEVSVGHQHEMFGTRPSGGLSPEAAKSDNEISALSKKIAELTSGPNLRAPREKGAGINSSGFLRVGERQVFLKLSEHDENTSEAAAWQVAKTLGWGDFVVPAYMTNYKGREGLVQEVLPAGKPFIQARQPKYGMESKLDERLSRLAMFEYVIGASDRHGGNYWVDSTKKLWSIDHGRSFVEGVRIPWSDAVARETYTQIRRDDIGHILNHQDAIIKAASKTTSYIDDSRGDKGVKARLTTLRKVYAESKGRDTVDLTRYVGVG